VSAWLLCLAGLTVLVVFAAVVVLAAAIMASRTQRRGEDQASLGRMGAPTEKDAA
jgi:predicted lysophospholipase L1 biosynthesis ABC-type transport system permease subunit